MLSVGLPGKVINIIIFERLKHEVDRQASDKIDVV